MRPSPRNNAPLTALHAQCGRVNGMCTPLGRNPISSASNIETRPWPKLSQHDLTRISASITPAVRRRADAVAGRRPAATSALPSTRIWRRSSAIGALSSRMPTAPFFKASIGWRPGSAISACATACGPPSWSGATARARSCSCCRCRFARAALRASSTWLGSELCDYNAPLLAASVLRTRRSRAFHGAVEKHRALPAEAIRACATISSILTKMPEMVGAQQNPMRHLGGTINPSGAYLTHLSGDWETFYTAKRSSATRRRDRTKRKKLAEFGEVTLRQPGGRRRNPAHARHFDGAEGAIVCPHGRRQSVCQAGLCGILSRARHRSGDPASRACEPARRRHDRRPRSISG